MKGDPLDVHWLRPAGGDSLIVKVPDSMREVACGKPIDGRRVRVDKNVEQEIVSESLDQVTCRKCLAIARGAKLKGSR